MRHVGEIAFRCDLLLRSNTHRMKVLAGFLFICGTLAVVAAPPSGDATTPHRRNLTAEYQAVLAVAKDTIVRARKPADLDDLLDKLESLTGNGTIHFTGPAPSQEMFQKGHGHAPIHRDLARTISRPRSRANPRRRARTCGRSSTTGIYVRWASFGGRSFSPCSTAKRKTRPPTGPFLKTPWTRSMPSCPRSRRSMTSPAPWPRSIKSRINLSISPPSTRWTIRASTCWPACL